MNTRKTIYDKLFTEKVELAKHEVELSITNEILDIIKIYESKIIPDYVRIEKERVRLGAEVKKLKEDSKAAYDLYLKSSERAFAARKQYIDLAKQLGIDYKTEVFNKMMQVSEAKEDIGRAYKTYDFIANQVKFSF
jgi:hypothetical protein